MQVEVSRENITKAVLRAEKVSGKNLTLPVLNCVLLVADRNVFKIKATNLELGIEVVVPAKISQEGVVAVPGGVLASVLNGLSRVDHVTLKVEQDNLRIETSHGKTVIKAVAYEDFPTLPYLPDAKPFSFDVEHFLQGVRSVWYSASVSMVKPEQASVYVYLDSGRMYFVATDSFRLAEKKVAAQGVDGFDSMLIPIKNVSEISRTLDGFSGAMEVRVTKDQVSFLMDGVYITSRLIDGSFPDYHQIIPKESVTDVTLLKQDLVNTLKRMTVFSDKFNQVHFSVKPAQKKFTISAQNADVGETTDSIEAAIEGEELEINFNHRYISDCFQSIPGDSVTLSFSGLSKPVIIRGVSDSSFLYLAMPMNR